MFQVESVHGFASPSDLGCGLDAHVLGRKAKTGHLARDEEREPMYRGTSVFDVMPCFGNAFQKALRCHRVHPSFNEELHIDSWIYLSLVKSVPSPHPPLKVEAAEVAKPEWICIQSDHLEQFVGRQTLLGAVVGAIVACFTNHLAHLLHDTVTSLARPRPYLEVMV
jgi:hypothetical protein